MKEDPFRVRERERERERGRDRDRQTEMCVCVCVCEESGAGKEKAHRQQLPGRKPQYESDQCRLGTVQTLLLLDTLNDEAEQGESCR